MYLHQHTIALVTRKGTRQEPQHIAASAVQKQNKINQSLPHGLIAQMN